MKRLTETEYQEQLAKAQETNAAIERGRQLKAEKNKYAHKIHFPSTSKMMAVYLFLILNVILIYAMAAMWYFADLTYLGVLVTDIGGQVMTYFIYAKKATKENTAGGITYDLAMQNCDSSDNIIITGDVEDSDTEEAVG